jgi:crotonobetainyl-CoA:carnitine CoA-transferase CaiB-like acyl-CoA transferase
MSCTPGLAADRTISDTPAIPTQVFAGVRVLEISGSIWSEYASKLFADFGADVVKCEDMTNGVATRLWRPVPTDSPDLERGPLHLHLNTNKRSIAVDLRREADRLLVLDMVRSCDAIIESLGPGGLESLALDPHTLRAANPLVVITRVSPFGQTGPNRNRAATGLTLQAAGGPMNATGIAGRAPLRKPGNLEHYTIGRATAEATMAGLLAARRFGHGSVIDVSAQEVLLSGADRRAAYLLAASYSGMNAPRGVRSAHRGLSKFTGPFAAKDGYIMVYVTNQTFSDRLIALASEGDAEFGAQYLGRTIPLEEFEQFRHYLIDWFATRNKQDLMEAAEAARIPLTAYLSMREILDHAHFRNRSVFVSAGHPLVGTLDYLGPPWRMDGGYRLNSTAPQLNQHEAEIRRDAAEAANTRPTPIRWPDKAPRQREESDRAAELPLQGIRIVDLTVVWSGPGGTALLGDLGAEVIRLEGNNRICRQDSAKWTRESLRDAGYRIGAFPDREPQPHPYDRSAMFNWHARNKLAACANLETEAGREAVLRLVDISDVLVENNSVSTLAKLGLSTEDLLRRNPNLIVVRMPPMGLDGPMSGYLGFGPNFNALVGVGVLEGYEGETVDQSGDNYHMDEASPWGVAFAIMAALWRREQVGRVGLVEFAQSENLMQEVGEYLLDVQLSGREPIAFGNTDPVLLQDVFKCEGDDLWVAISVRDDVDWAQLCAEINDGNLAAAGATPALRQQNSIALRREIAAWASSRSLTDIVDALVAKDVPVFPIMSETALLSDSHLGSREWFVSRTHPSVGTHQYPGHAWRADGFSTVFGRPLPSFGEDNEYVYRDLLQYNEFEYADLRDRGLVTEEQFA